MSQDSTVLPYPFTTGAELLAHCAAKTCRISDVMLANELAWRTEAELREELLNIWAVMRDCVDNGCASEGILPGGLKVPPARTGPVPSLQAPAGRHGSRAGHGMGEPVRAGGQ